MKMCFISCTVLAGGRDMSVAFGTNEILETLRMIEVKIWI